MTTDIRSAGDAERASVVLIDHYLSRAESTRRRRHNSDLTALGLGTASLIAIGLNWRSDLAVAAGLGGSALRQYVTIDQPRGPTPSLLAVNQTACVAAQLPPLVEFEQRFPTADARQRVPQLDRAYSSTLASARNGLWVIYTNFRASTGETPLKPDDLPTWQAPEPQIAEGPMSSDEQFLLSSRMSASLSQLAACPRLISGFT